MDAHNMSQILLGIPKKGGQASNYSSELRSAEDHHHLKLGTHTLTIKSCCWHFKLFTSISNELISSTDALPLNMWAIWSSSDLDSQKNLLSFRVTALEMSFFTVVWQKTNPLNHKKSAIMDDASALAAYGGRLIMAVMQFTHFETTWNTRAMSLKSI